MISSPIPQISISFAPEEAIIPEPKSPLDCFAYQSANNEDDSFRSKHLTPPPTISPRFFQKASSPLRPDKPAQEAGKGLEKDRFEAMLRATRERCSAKVGVRQPDLRKEVALKVHKTKQVERRALFLSKVMAPPSPSATTMPKTPPESPAIFHYTLPSPGLVSPLALFESLSNEDEDMAPRQSWVEQVDFRRRDGRKSPKSEIVKEPPSISSSHKHSLPSLDEISARVISQRRASLVPTIKVVDSDDYIRRPSSLRLPAFLKQKSSGSPAITTAPEPAPIPRPRLAISSTGRLNMSVRPSANALIHAPKPKVVAPPHSPLLSPELQVTTLVVPRTRTSSPTKLSESNVHALASREKSSRNMISTLKRRTPASNVADDLNHGHGRKQQDNHQEGPRSGKWKRHSAPAEMQPRPRNGFSHSVLGARGGF